MVAWQLVQAVNQSSGCWTQGWCGIEGAEGGAKRYYAILYSTSSQVFVQRRQFENRGCTSGRRPNTTTSELMLGYEWLDRHH